MKVVVHPGLRSALLLWGALQLGACTVVAPGDAGPAENKEPGRPFSENICFHCSLRACVISTNACTYERTCSDWLNCVAVCPTDETGVAADGPCIRKCGVPASAEVLFGCIQDYSTGFLTGCEQACAPSGRVAN